MPESPEAWNNFILRSAPADDQAGSALRAAAISAQYMSAANNGGINSFLTCTADLDAAEVLAALTLIGAHAASRELGRVLNLIGVPIPVCSNEERSDLMEECWPEAADEHDVLSESANADLLRALEAHVSEHQDFYLALR